MKKIICAIITALLLTLTGNNTLAMKNKHQNSDICCNRYGYPIRYNNYMLCNNGSPHEAMSLSKKMTARYTPSYKKLQIFKRKSTNDAFEKKTSLIIKANANKYTRLLFSPDEKKLATFSITPGLISIYDIENNKRIGTQEVTCFCNHVFFSYDSNLIGYCSSNSLIEITNLKTQKLTWKHKCDSDFFSSIAIDVKTAQISHDNKYVVSISDLDLFDLDHDSIEKTLEYIQEAITQYRTLNSTQNPHSFIVEYVLKKTNILDSALYKEYIKYITQRFITFKTKQQNNPQISLSKKNIIYPNLLLIQVWDIENNNRIFSMPIFSYDNENLKDIESVFITTKTLKYCYLGHRDGSITVCNLDETSNPTNPESFTNDYNYEKYEKPMVRIFDRDGRLRLHEIAPHYIQVQKKRIAIFKKFTTDNQIKILHEKSKKI